MNKLSLLFFALLTICNVSAQETVKLTVNGQGATKEEATANALRSAIEQSFGVFVSANTQILNDEVVKDEIATIASGNIKEFKELGCITLPNGDQSISLSATVSIGNLISYAKSKGASAEFAGQLFAMNMKMRKLNAENERKVIEHLKNQLSILAPNLFKVELLVDGAPIKTRYYNNGFREIEIPKGEYYSIPLKISYYTTKASQDFYSLLVNTLKSISLSEAEILEYKKINESVYRCENQYFDKFVEDSPDRLYKLAFRTYFMDDLSEYLMNTIMGVAMFSSYQLELETAKGCEQNKFHVNTLYGVITAASRPIYNRTIFEDCKIDGDYQFCPTKNINCFRVENSLFHVQTMNVVVAEKECAEIVAIKINKSINEDSSSNSNDVRQGSIELDEGLRSRGLVGNLSMPTYVSGVNAKIVIRVAVDNDGRVTSARYESKGSTSSDLALIKASENAAKQARFTESTDFIQGGWITYNFK